MSWSKCRDQTVADKMSLNNNIAGQKMSRTECWCFCKSLTITPYICLHCLKPVKPLSVAVNILLIIAFLMQLSVYNSYKSAGSCHLKYETYKSLRAPH